MKNQTPAFVLALLTILLPDLAHAGPDSCSLKQDNRASENLAKATSLGELYSISKEVPGCMRGGGISEEVSDDVVVRLSRHWRSSLDELSRDKNNSDLVSFILRHIDETTNPNDLRVILSYSKSACLPEANTLCRKIGEAARVALNRQ